MIKKISTLVLVASLTLVSCDKKVKTTDEVAVDSTTVSTDSIPAEATTNEVAYTVANRYFVKNTFKGEHFADAKIDTQAKFDELFGAAAVMGADGKPTAIDFAKQYVIAVTEKETDVETTLVPTSLTKDGETIMFKYEIKRGAKTTATMKPLLMVVVDKTVEGKVEVEGSEVK